MNMKITCNLYEISKYFDIFVNNMKEKFFILSGKEGTGKTSVILKLVKNYNINYNYFSPTEKENQIENLLESLGINRELYSKIKYLQFFSPSSFSNNESFKLLLLNDYFENISKSNESKILIFDDFDKYNSDLKDLLIINFRKLLNAENSVKIIIIFTDVDENDQIYLKSISDDIMIYELEPLDFEHLIKFFEENGYQLPNKIIEIIYKYSDGFLKDAFKIIKILEDFKFIVNKNFVKPLSRENLEFIKNIIMMNKNVNINNLSDDQINLLLFLTYINNSIKLSNINKYINIKIDDIIQLENLQIIKRINEDLIYLSTNFNPKELEEIISNTKKMFIKMRAIKYLEDIKDYINLGIIYLSMNLHDKAHNYLREYGLKEYYNGNFSTSLKALGECWKYHTDDKEIGLALIKIYNFYEDFEHSLMISEKLFEKFKNDCEIKIIHSINLYKKEDYDNSYKILNSLINECADLNILSQAYFYYSILLKIYGKINESIKFLNKAEDIAIKLKDYDILQKIYRLLGNIYYEKRDLNSATDYYLKSAEICKDIGNYYDLASTYNNLGNVYSEIDISKGIEYYSETLSIAKKYWYPSLIISSNSNLAIMKWYNFEIKDAYEMMINSYILSLSNNNYTALLLSSINIAELSLEMGNYADIYLFIEKAYNYMSNKTDVYLYDELKFYYKIINFIYKKINFSLDEFIELKNSGLSQFISFYYYNTIRYYIYFGDFEKASNYFDEYLKIKENKFTIDDYLFISFYLQNIMLHNLKQGMKIDEYIYNIYKILENGVKKINSVLINEIFNVLKLLFNMPNINELSTELIYNDLEKFKNQNLIITYYRLLLIYFYILNNYHGDSSYLNMVKDLIRQNHKTEILKIFI
ncbi:MAG: tetratricopeptide repeat protein [Thermoplasmata archaeon]